MSLATVQAQSGLQIGLVWDGRADMYIMHADMYIMRTIMPLSVGAVLACSC